MELFKGSNIDWIGKRFIFFFISGSLMLAAVAVSLIKRPNMSIEFTGGTLVQVKFNELPPIDKIRESINADGWEGFSLQSQPEDKSIIVRLKEGSQSKEDISAKLIATLKKQFSGNVKEIPDRVEFVGPVIGKKLMFDAFMSILGSLLVIVVYVAIRFRSWVWGAVGVLALAHDVLITFGLLVLLNREITLVIIAALLTLAGYSINDTIVIFDRVRENIRGARKESIESLYNRSVNETLGRTINTSLTAFMAACSLLFGGQVLVDFAIAMAFGIFVGSYSSIGVCVSMVYQWEMKGKKS